MPATHMSRWNKTFSINYNNSLEAWETPAGGASTYGPILDLRGMTAGSILRSGVAQPNFFVVGQSVRDPDASGQGYDLSVAKDALGATISSPVMGDGDWTMMPYEWFFFPFIQIQCVAPTAAQYFLVHMKG